MKNLLVSLCSVLMVATPMLGVVACDDKQRQQPKTIEIDDINKMLEGSTWSDPKNNGVYHLINEKRDINILINSNTEKVDVPIYDYANDKWKTQEPYTVDYNLCKYFNFFDNYRYDVLLAGMAFASSKKGLPEYKFGDPWWDYRKNSFVFYFDNSKYGSFSATDANGVKKLFYYVPIYSAVETSYSADANTADAYKYIANFTKYLYPNENLAEDAESYIMESYWTLPHDFKNYGDEDSPFISKGLNNKFLQDELTSKLFWNYYKQYLSVFVEGPSLADRISLTLTPFDDSSYAVQKLILTCTIKDHGKTYSYPHEWYFQNSH